MQTIQTILYAIQASQASSCSGTGGDAINSIGQIRYDLVLGSKLHRMYLHGPRLDNSSGAAL